MLSHNILIGNGPDVLGQSLADNSKGIFVVISVNSGINGNDSHGSDPVHAFVPDFVSVLCNRRITHHHSKEGLRDKPAKYGQYGALQGCKHQTHHDQILRVIVRHKSFQNFSEAILFYLVFLFQYFVLLVYFFFHFFLKLGLFSFNAKINIFNIDFFLITIDILFVHFLIDGRALLLNKPGIHPIRVLGKQFTVISHFYNFSFVQNVDSICVLNGRQPVGNDQGGDLTELLTDVVDGFLHL